MEVPISMKGSTICFGVLDPSDDHMILFYVEKYDHLHLLCTSLHHECCSQWCIINKGAFTYVMSTQVWKQLGSLKISPSIITLFAYDCHP